MLPSTAIIKGREVVVAVDKMVEFFDIEVEMLEELVDEEMAVRSQDHNSERSMILMMAVIPSTRCGDWGVIVWL